MQSSEGAPCERTCSTPCAKYFATLRNELIKIIGLTDDLPQFVIALLCLSLDSARITKWPTRNQSSPLPFRVVLVRKLPEAIKGVITKCCVATTCFGSAAAAAFRCRSTHINPSHTSEVPVVGMQ